MKVIVSRFFDIHLTSYHVIRFTGCMCVFPDDDTLFIHWFLLKSWVVFFLSFIS